MVTEKELVEAHTFNRRRLVAAFVSGRDARPPRTGRAVGGGLVLAAVLVGGAAVPRLLASWDQLLSVKPW